MTNIISFPRRIDADDAIDSQLTSVNSTLAGAAHDLAQIARRFEQKAVSSVIAAVGDLEYGAIQLRRAAQLIEKDPLRKTLDVEILKIEHLINHAKKSLSGLS